MEGSCPPIPEVWRKASVPEAVGLLRTMGVSILMNTTDFSLSHSSVFAVGKVSLQFPFYLSRKQRSVAVQWSPPREEKRTVLNLWFWLHSPLLSVKSQPRDCSHNWEQWVMLLKIVSGGGFDGIQFSKCMAVLRWSTKQNCNSAPMMVAEVPPAPESTELRNL